MNLFASSRFDKRHFLILLFISIVLPSVHAQKRQVTETDLDLAMISDEAYSADPKKNINDRWVYVDESPFNDPIGEIEVGRGVVYRNAITKRIAVAFRGTDNLDTDLKNGFAQLRGNYTPNLEGALSFATRMSRDQRA